MTVFTDSGTIMKAYVPDFHDSVTKGYEATFTANDYIGSDTGVVTKIAKIVFTLSDTEKKVTDNNNLIDLLIPVASGVTVSSSKTYALYSYTGLDQAGTAVTSNGQFLRWEGTTGIWIRVSITS